MELELDVYFYATANNYYAHGNLVEESYEDPRLWHRTARFAAFSGICQFICVKTCVVNNSK